MNCKTTRNRRPPNPWPQLQERPGPAKKRAKRAKQRVKKGTKKGADEPVLGDAELNGLLPFADEVPGRMINDCQVSGYIVRLHVHTRIPYNS